MKFSRFRYTISGLMILVAVAAVALAWVTGRSRPEQFPVSGTVTYNGLPLGQGKISFLPSNPAGVQATGQVVGGKYTLTSFTPGDGASPGTYTIVLVSPSISAKYQTPTTSGLTAAVQKSANVID